MGTKLEESRQTKATYLEDGRVELKSSIGPSKLFTKTEYEQYKRRLRDAARRYQEKENRERQNPNKRTLQLLYNAYNTEIESIVFGKNRYSVPNFTRIRITQEALDKANLIARRTVDLTGENEVYMHLLNHKEKRNLRDTAVRDVYILRDQRISPVSCGRPSIKGEVTSMKDIDAQGDYILGWGHSHGNMSTFHSPIDTRNLDNLVSLTGTRIDITPKPFACSDTSFIFRFIPSLVFNAKGDTPSCAIGIAYPHFELGSDSIRAFYINKSPQLEIIQETNRIELDQEQIDKQIIGRTDYGRKISIRKLPTKPKIELEKELVKEKSDKEIRAYIEGLKDGARAELTEKQELSKRISSLERRYDLLRKRYYILNREHKKYEERLSNLEQRLEGFGEK